MICSHGSFWGLTAYLSHIFQIHRTPTFGGAMWSRFCTQNTKVKSSWIVFAEALTREEATAAFIGSPRRGHWIQCSLDQWWSMTQRIHRTVTIPPKNESPVLQASSFSRHMPPKIFKGRTELKRMNGSRFFLKQRFLRRLLLPSGIFDAGPLNSMLYYR